VTERPHLNHRVDGGLGAETPVMLIHGVGDRLGSWDAVVRRLGGHRPVVRYDLRGHGSSERPVGPYSLADFADDHVGLMDELHVDRAHVVGFSLGGLIAQQVALDHPGRIASLVLAGTVAGRTAQERERVAERLRQVEEGGPSAVADGGARWYTQAFRERHPDVVARQMQEFASNDPAAYAAAYRVLATSDLADRLSEIQAPVLAITGEHDVGSPPHMSELIARRVARGRCAILPGARHSLPIEQSEELGEAIAGFLRDVESTAKREMAR
jgi:3-oxoadipate enol-lactonase